jgi:leucyl-tRNA synthetase
VREALESLVIMLTPFAPHVAEEMWEGWVTRWFVERQPRGRSPIRSSRGVKSWRFRFR